MTTVLLAPTIADQMASEAKQREQSIDTLVNDWLEEYLWRERQRKIHLEAARFQAQHAALLAQYGSGYLAMYNGQVVDTDQELEPLHRRIRMTYGDEPVLITPLTVEPTQTFRVLGARRTLATVTAN